MLLCHFQTQKAYGKDEQKEEKLAAISGQPFNNVNEETMKKNDADFDIIWSQGVFKDCNGVELEAFATMLKESAWQEWSEKLRQNNNYLTKVLADSFKSTVEKVVTSVQSLSDVSVQFQTNSITVVARNQ